VCFVKIRNEIKILKKDKEEDPGGGGVPRRVEGKEGRG